MASRPAVLHGLTFVEYLNDGLKFMTTINTAKRRPGTFTSRIVTIPLMIQVNISRPRQNVPHFVDAIVKCILLNEKVEILFKIWLTNVSKGPVNDNEALIEAMAVMVKKQPISWIIDGLIHRRIHTSLGLSANMYLSWYTPSIYRIYQSINSMISAWMKCAHNLKQNNQFQITCTY